MAKVGITVEVNGHHHHMYFKSVKEVSTFLTDLATITTVKWDPGHPFDTKEGK
jgi:hypothetical protein